ncbi:hypothetical protein HHK36_005060 [Tetracentron sinense]|uniref:LOB domain-containing protein n=1 Tax=Tetracentron sinense TaxID=13715 RepID=A0A834ZK68_TETSI|nr:hypothetical protein HHK36_005060 [Tetracentron sinense]
MQNPNEEREAGQGSALHRACAACKHQRKGCKETCVLAPFFPSSKKDDFVAVYEVFGVSNIHKMLKRIETYAQQEKVIESLIWEAKWRQYDPVNGVMKEFEKVSKELERVSNELNLKNQITVPVPVQEAMVYNQTGNNMSSSSSRINNNSATNNYGNIMLESDTYSVDHHKQVLGYEKGNQIVVAHPESIHSLNQSSINSLDLRYYYPDECCEETGQFKLGWKIIDAEFSLFYSYIVLASSAQLFKPNSSPASSNKQRRVPVTNRLKSDSSSAVELQDMESEFLEKLLRFSEMEEVFGGRNRKRSGDPCRLCLFFRGDQWNSGGQCHKEIEPIFNQSHLAKYPSKMRALEHVLQEMRTPVVYLNISRLTDYRKDGHPSIYRKKYKTVKEQLAAERSQDCSHWCLPGVPDTWNELLYASLLKTGRGSWRN